MQNVSHENHENHLIFMRMTVQVTSYFHTNSFAQRLVLQRRVSASVRGNLM